MTHKTHIDQAALVAELGARWLAGMDEAARAEGQKLLAELVADWAREAESDADPAAVQAVQKQDFEEAGQGQGPAQRLITLRTEVLERRIARLRVRTYALGKALIDGTVGRGAARDEGKLLLVEAEGLAVRVRAVGDAVAAARLQGALGDALMEALYAVEGKAMSPRLGRYQADHLRRPAQ
jgi:hypothetical protein